MKSKENNFLPYNWWNRFSQIHVFCMASYLLDVNIEKWDPHFCKRWKNKKGCVLRNESFCCVFM